MNPLLSMNQYSIQNYITGNFVHTEFLSFQSIGKILDVEYCRIYSLKTFLYSIAIDFPKSMILNVYL